MPTTTLHVKKLSSGSDEFKSNEATINEEMTMDHGENSTTLSSINDSQKETPEKNRKTPLHGDERSFYSFRREIEFKEMLKSLDIENIEISLSHRQVSHHEADDQPEQSSIKEKFNIDIEKLLSDDDEEDAHSVQLSVLQNAASSHINSSLKPIDLNRSGSIVNSEAKSSENSSGRNDIEGNENLPSLYSRKLNLKKFGTSNHGGRRLQIFEEITESQEI